MERSERPKRATLPRRGRKPLKWRRRFEPKHDWSAVALYVLKKLLARHGGVLVHHPHALVGREWEARIEYDSAAMSDVVKQAKTARLATIEALEALGLEP